MGTSEATTSCGCVCERERELKGERLMQRGEGGKEHAHSTWAVAKALDVKRRRVDIDLATDNLDRSLRQVQAPKEQHPHIGIGGHLPKGVLLSGEPCAQPSTQAPCWRSRKRSTGTCTVSRR